MVWNFILRFHFDKRSTHIIHNTNLKVRHNKKRRQCTPKESFLFAYFETKVNIRLRFVTLSASYYVVIMWERVSGVTEYRRRPALYDVRVVTVVLSAAVVLVRVSVTRITGLSHALISTYSYR